MSLVPRSMSRNWWDDMDRFHREVEDHFHQVNRSNVHDSWWRMPLFPSFRNMFGRWRSWSEDLDQIGGSAKVECDENKYQVMVDMKQFTPEEITVRTDDKYITIEGKHESRWDPRKYISRQFVRRYALPKGYNINRVNPSLSSDGILTITAPRLALPPGERILPIRRSFSPAIKAA